MKHTVSCNWYQNLHELHAGFEDVSSLNLINIEFNRVITGILLFIAWRGSA